MGTRQCLGRLVLDGLKTLQKSQFDPENIGAEAKRKLIFQNIVQQIARLAEDPTEQFVRMLVQNAGLSHVRAKALGDYAELAKSAFREFISIRILQRLDLPTKSLEGEKTALAAEAIASDAIAKSDDGIVTTETEIHVYNYVVRRLSFLIKDEALFNKIDDVKYRDYKGKFVVYFLKERAGRLFDFVEGGQKPFNFDFGAANGGCVATSALSDIDAILVNIFTKRVAELTTSADKNVK